MYVDSTFSRYNYIYVIVDTVLKEYQFQQNENRVQAEKLIEAVNMFNRIMLE